MAGIANLQINVDARSAIQKLREFTQGSRSAAAASQELSRGSTDVSEKLRSEAKAADVAGGKLNQLAGVLGRVAIAATAIQAARFVVAKTSELETQTRSLQTLTGSAERAAQIISELQQLGAVTPFTSTELIDAAKRLQAFGVEAKNVVETTRRLADVSGATGAELQGLVTAYGQVQAKGRLQGEELLQFQERGISLQKELQKMYGMTGEEFQKALSKGQVSAKAAEVAIIRLTSAGGKYANGAIAQSTTLAGKFSTLTDGIESIAKTIGTVLTPAIKAVLNEAIFAVNAINNLMAAGARAKGFGLDQGARKRILDQALKEAEGIVGQTSETGRRIKNPFERGRLIQEIAAQRERDLIESYGYRTGQIKPAIKPSTPAIITPPLLGTMIGGGTAGAGGGRAGGAGKADKGRAAEALEEARRASQMMKIELRQQIDLNNAATDIERERLKIQFTYLDRLRQIKDLKDDKRRIELKALAATLRDQDLMKLVTKEMQEQNKLLYDRAGLSMTATYGPGAGAFRTDINLNPLAAADPIGDYKQRLKELQDPINLARTGAESISSAFNNAFTDIISGTKGAQDALSTMFRGIANSFTSMATDLIAQMLKIYVFKQLAGLLGLGGNGAGGMFTGGGPVSGASVFGLGQAGFTGLGFAAGMPSLAARAMGGPVTAGQPYLVGERGPELFVPSGGGNVLPSGKGGGNVTVNVSVDATGSQVAGDNEQASQLGRVIAAAVQSELIKAKRPGGILNS